MFYPVVGRICICLALIACTSAGMARDYFTEVFNGDFDLSFTTFTFKPDRSSNGYAVCRSPATQFPTPTTNGFVFLQAGPTFATLPDSSLPLFGERYRSLVINANGSVTYDAAANPEPSP